MQSGTTASRPKQLSHSFELAKRSSHRAERCPELLREQLGLLPGGEVAAFLHLVEVDEVRIRLLGPAAWRLILLARKDAHCHRDGDTLGVEEAASVFPVEPRRRDSRIRQPVERDVVEDLVT